MAKYRYEDGLETPRMRTRFLTRADILPWTEFFRDKEAVELFPTFGLTLPEERAERWIEKTLARYQDGKFGLQVLVDKSTNAFIGQCGLLEQEVDGVREIEVGYHIYKKYWGQGYAPEAARMFIDYGFTHQLADSIISIIDIRNTKSQRVAEKNGLIREKQIRWSDLDVWIYRITRQH